MTYTIKEFALKTGLSAPTLRFYEDEGVLPFVKRDAVGNRVYDDVNAQWIDFILALRSTGMTVANIRRYVDLYQRGNVTLAERKAMLVMHRQTVQRALDETERHLRKIEHKLDLYAQLEADPERTDIVI